MGRRDPLEHGRDCYGRRAWGDAYQALLCADQAAALQPDDLDRLATAAFLTGRDDEFQRLQERLHRLHADADDVARAARCAFWLALISLLRVERPVSECLDARGQRLVDDHDCAERGYLCFAVAEQQLREGHADAAAATASQAAAIGESFREADLMAAARHVQGRALIDQGDVVAGLKRLDETMLAVVAGELSPIMTGLMYCSVIDTCRQVYALGRAREWTSAFSRVCDQQPEMVAFSWSCLVHRAEIMQLQGEWPDALTEACRLVSARSARSESRPAPPFINKPRSTGCAASLRRRKTPITPRANCGCEPQPGLALLRLAQGRTDAACAAIRRLTSATSDRLRRARLLPAYLEIMLASEMWKKPAAPATSCGTGHAFDTDGLRAVVAQADGAIALVEGHAHAALDPLRCAFEQWQRLEAPYEAARVRVLIGHACRALGDEEAAALEHKAARSEFERLGAQPELARLDAPDACLAHPPPDIP